MCIYLPSNYFFSTLSVAYRLFLRLCVLYSVTATLPVVLVLLIKTAALRDIFEKSRLALTFARWSYFVAKPTWVWLPLRVLWWLFLDSTFFSEAQSTDAVLSLLFCRSGDRQADLATSVNSREGSGKVRHMSGEAWDVVVSTRGEITFEWYGSRWVDRKSKRVNPPLKVYILCWAVSVAKDCSS